MTFDFIAPVLATDRKSPMPPDGVGRHGIDAGTRLATHVLVIEDELMIAWTLETLLSDAGFADVAIAADAEEARRAAADMPPGLVLSDINLGAGMDGVDASIAICHAAGIPVLFVTAYADYATRTRIAGHFPTAELLRKPIDGPTLVAAVHRALDRLSGH